MTPDELKSRRRALGFTQRQLAALLGRHHVTVSKWEAGMQPIDAPETLSLALERLEQLNSRRKDPVMINASEQYYQDLKAQIDAEATRDTEYGASIRAYDKAMLALESRMPLTVLEATTFVPFFAAAHWRGLTSAQALDEARDRLHSHFANTRDTSIANLKTCGLWPWKDE